MGEDKRKRGRRRVSAWCSPRKAFNTSQDTSIVRSRGRSEKFGQLKQVEPSGFVLQLKGFAFPASPSLLPILMSRQNHERGLMTSRIRRLRPNLPIATSIEPRREK